VGSEMCIRNKSIRSEYYLVDAHLYGGGFKQFS
jgi:hypothetical protein